MAKVKWINVLAGVAIATAGFGLTPGVPDGELVGVAIIANEFGVLEVLV